MTIDKQEIKMLSLACDPEKCSDEDEECRRLGEFHSELTPETVLALLAEIERLEGCEEVLRNLASYAGYEDYDTAAVDHVGFARQIMEGIKILNDPLAQLAEKRGAERDQLKAENEALRKDAERYRFVRNPIGTSSPLAIWNEGKMPLFSGMADAVVDEFMAKEASHD